ncbi:MAG: isoaspartyl peptidase/L-asparaginase family protein [candidate division NC10 bacterium]|nr:isoaspartyl peptidase/L-asparaginase family protein [candidate division NC10 bacterium]
MKRVIVVHGGAGRVPEEEWADRHEGCRDAAAAGWEILTHGGSALDAVERVVAFLEDHPLFNAGRGSVLNAEGDVEMDASLMEGRALRAGAVGAVRNIRNPIRLARRILEDGRHVLLIGEGADRFARESGLEACPPEWLVTERQRERWRTAQDPGDGTVGAVAVDGAGDVSAATSTGGLFGKRPGRVGDSALIGSGTYADQFLGAASATGNGEAIIRVVLAKTAVELLRGDRHPEEAARMAIEILGRRGQGEAGIILVDRLGRIGYAHDTPFMSCVFMDETTETPTLLS